MSPTPIPPPSNNNASRRSFLQGGALILAGSRFTTAAESEASDSKRLLRAGLITDLHYADKDPRGTRHYRETLTKLEEAAKHFEKDRPEFVVELGDLIDAADSVAVEMKYLERINREFSALPGQKHYVLGNHCVDTLTKEEFLGSVGQEGSYGSFDAAGIHFVLLDSCFRSDGVPYSRRNFQWTDPNIPAEELEWLAADLEKTEAQQVIVFAHQRLDVSDNHGVKNAPAVRKILEASGKVQAVFQGHSHKNDLKDIGGIHYVTLVAMVEGSGKENNGYSALDFLDDGSIRLSGQRNQADYEWK